MSEKSIVINGINGVLGDYLLPPMSAQQISRIAQGTPLDPQHLKELKWWHQRNTQATLGPKEGVNPKDLSATGWGVIFAHNAAPAAREALGELLVHRRAQATKHHEHYYQEYWGENAYRPGESKQKFLARHGAGPGPADPEKVPYYLLIVGDPETIPFSFQYQLDVQYAVGRIHFNSLEEYAQYAHNVVAVETGPLNSPRRATFFGVRNMEDRATHLSADHLVKPLAEILGKDRPQWQIETVLEHEATKKRLRALLGGTKRRGCCSRPVMAWGSLWATLDNGPAKGRCCVRTGRVPTIMARFPRIFTFPLMI